ncbi:hypothetical protein [Spirosoma fluminis]
MKRLAGILPVKIGWYTAGKDQYDPRDEASELMSYYGQTTNAGVHYNSPFWWFREAFSQAIGVGQDDFMKATLWTNLSKIDVGKTTPKGKEAWKLFQLFIQLLIEEIRIVKPDIVLIMTKDGLYNWHLDNYRWVSNKPFSSYDEPDEITREPILDKQIQRLIVPGILPYHTYQICHPNALRRQGNYTERADVLIKELSTLVNQNS